MKRFNLIIGIMLLVVGLPLVLAACGGGGPAPLERSFQLDFRAGKGFGGVSEYSVNEGEKVTFSIRSNRTINLNLGGYDISTVATPNKTVFVELTADTVGRFPIVDTDTGEEVGFLVVAPKVAKE